MATVNLNLPDETARRLDEFATAERRSRSNAATVLLEEALQRTIAEAKSAENGPERAASAAAAAHLAAHRRLGGRNGE
jgi:predicted transcriptional regulator